MRHEYHIIQCKQCGKEIRRYVEITSAFCSNSCKGIWQQTNLTGTSNPNYAKKWSDQKKKDQGIIIKKQMDTTEIKNKCGSANKNKKFSKERKKNMSNAQMGHKPYFVMTDDIRLKIGTGSKNKFTDEYHKNMRKQMENIGKWIPLNKKNQYEIYRELSNWNNRMFDLYYIENIQLLKMYGIFNAKLNKNGVVRDHMYSRRSGYNNMVFPEILRHPCNCRIVTHYDNVKFAHSNSISDDYISLIILFERILNFDKEWHEQDVCISLIEKYKNNERFNIKKYIETHV